MNRHERRKAQKNKPSGGSLTENSAQLSQMDQASLIQMREAVVAQQNGDHDSAEIVYRRLLKKFPNNPDCLNLLGVSMRHIGNPKESEKLIRQAIELSSSSDFQKNLSNALRDQYKYEEAKDAFSQYLDHTQPSAVENSFMGSLLHNMGSYEEALTYFQKSLVQVPDDTNTLNNLGATYLDMGQLDDTKRILEQALEIDPDNANCLSNYGLYHSNIGNADKAIELFKKALSIEPDNISAEQNLADISTEGMLEETLATILTNLPNSKNRLKSLKSIALLNQKLGRNVEALDYLHQVMELTPEDPSVLTQFATSLANLKRFDEAIPYVEAALQLSPLFCDAYICYGEVNRALCDFEFAAACFMQALALKPGDINIISNLGVVLMETGHIERAEEAFETVLEINPKFYSGRYNFSFLLLREGKLKEGWAEYAFRYKVQKFWSFTPLRHFPQPQWDGSSLKGKRILLWGEQGIGDVILFANTIPDVMKEGGEVHIECIPRLTGLFQQSFPDAIIHEAPYEAAETGEDNFDYQIAFPDLCGIYRNSVEDFPKTGGFLTAEPGSVASLKVRLDAISDRPKIGISWRSMFMTKTRQLNYAKVEELAPILNMKGVDFINLQYGDCQAELAEVRKRFGIEMHDWDDIDLKDDQQQLAALIKNMDMVVGASNATTNLAGALGVPTCMFIPSKQWTMLGSEGMPWLPTTKVFAKAASEDTWDEPFARIAEEIQSHTALQKQ